ncbi:HD-GYP domain-containing protein [Saccharospirillum salsuginis]|uniref:Phosphodiesterase n=1 Tax=Saccharospirillum salsuginis TaxID=418750 RepID=A0A918KG13_9GAMM|nr:HD-GYP domain-containing protein [Saccharospirillum salsuginis]GGX61430.1 phosphodiesterase [Saccharospirillum salsuginis]
MIKRIPVTSLRVGMYISDLNTDWIPHYNYSRKGKIGSEAVIEKIRDLGVSELYIDTARGLDSPDGIPLEEIDRLNEAALQKVGAQTHYNRPRVELEIERHRAGDLHDEAKQLIDTVMGDVKLGRSIDVDSVNDVADNLLESVLRNHNALSSLGRIRHKDAYLMEHSVNLAVLMSVYGRYRQFERTTLHDIMVGALLHDIGKIKIPDDVLHKPGRLNDREFEIIKRHALFSEEILKTTPGISPLTVCVAAQHHEKIDGSGYPHGLKGNEISEYGKMTAIVDVYDAITSDRVYHRGIPPTAAMKKLLEWTEHHLDRRLVETFIKCMGIYPVGSLVELESGLMGVVVEINEHSQLAPTVRLFYNRKLRQPVSLRLVDLSKPGNQDRIVHALDPIKEKVDINALM